MHVQQIEIVVFGDLRHPRRQGQAVRRILEQRVTGNLHLVILDARRARVQANRIRVGDEVHFVAAVGQLNAQFGGDDAAAAVGRIARDPDLHAFLDSRAARAAILFCDARGQRRRPDLAVDVLIRTRHVAASEPHAHAVAIRRSPSHRTLLSSSTAARPRSRPELSPNRRRCATAPVPCAALRSDRGPCTASNSIRARPTPPARRARFRRTRRSRPAPGSDCAASLYQRDAIFGHRDSQALPPRAILAQIEHVVAAADADHVRIRHAAFIPTSARPGPQHRRALLATIDGRSTIAPGRSGRALSGIRSRPGSSTGFRSHPPAPIRWPRSRRLPRSPDPAKSSCLLCAT